MGRRASGHAFMPDKYVFPGGKVDRTDRFVPAASEPDGDTVAIIGGGRAARAFGLACVREMFEETGLAIGVPGTANYTGTDPGWRAYFDCGLLPDLAALTFFLRAITPPHRVKRFDARFFMADAAVVLPQGQRPQDGAEMEDLRWFTIEEAYQLDLPNVTRFVIGEVRCPLEYARASPSPSLPALGSQGTPDGPSVTDFTQERIDASSWAGMVTALACGLVSAIGFALNAPLFALTMDDRGMDAGMVGVLMTIAGVAALVCTPAVPWLMARVPVKVILAGANIITSGLFLLYLVVDSVAGWTAIRFLFAASLTILFVSSEAWFLELAPARHRGKLLGLYAAVFAGGFGVGGLLIAELGHVGPAAPLAAAAISLLALPVMLLKAKPATRPEGAAGRPSALLARLALAPALFVPALAMGAIETGAFNLFPLWVRALVLKMPQPVF